MTDEGTDDGGGRDDRDGNAGDDRNGEAGTESTPGRTGASLSLNAILEILAHHHRREILRALIEAPSDTATVDELTERLARLEADRTGLRPGRDQLEVTFHHVHLPKLTDASLVEYDARSATLRYRPHDRVEELLEMLEDDGST